MGENKPNSAATANNKKRKQHYRPNNKPVKKKGAYPLRPGVQGFFITCDGGRERQASHEAINVIDSFYEELVHGKDSCGKLAVSSDKPLNKKIKFVYSDEEEEEDDDVTNDEKVEEEEEKKSDNLQTDEVKSENTSEETTENAKTEKLDQIEENTNHKDENGKDHENVKEPPPKKQCTEACVAHVEQKSIDKLIEEELKELGDKSKRRFLTLDSGCNGVVFVQMRKGDGDPSPKDIAQYMMTSVASTKKHMSRFILRVLPVEVSCYSSEEEISKAMVPLVEKYFPKDSQDSHKFAVLYEARANTGIDRMKIINAVAKSVPGPHKVDLNNPNKTIVVEIVKTVCLIGVVEKYKELAKYNLRQLTSPK